MTKIDPRDPRLARLGRFDGGEKACALWWSGAGLRIRLRCASLEAAVEAAEGEHLPWMGVEIDGAPMARLPLAAGCRRYVLLSGLDGETAHDVTVIRDTQPVAVDAGPLVIRALYTDGEVLEAKPRPLLVEFLGDSLTVGEGCAGPVSAQEWRMAYISGMRAFPALASELLGADRRVLALGGWGTWRSWDGKDECRIGAIYESLCAPVAGGGAPYAFDQRQPDAVVVNLGTNDNGAVKLLPESERSWAREMVTRRAVELMETVRRHAPEAPIVWAYGLCGHDLEEPLRRAVESRRAAGDENTYYLSLTEHCDMGSRSHPGPDSHRRCAGEIADFLRDKIRRQA